MELNLETIVLLVITLLTGLSAGLCFTWNNAVTTRIERLDDINYLQAFQQMNRTILNPLFFIVFFGPVLLGIIASFTYKTYPTHILWMLIAATAIYFIGVALVTIFGNVPLNELLDRTTLTDISIEDATSLRNRFEAKWNRLHLVRTLSAIASFILLILTCLLKNSTINI